MKLVISGTQSEHERYSRLVEAFVEHYDNLRVGSAFRDPALASGQQGYSKQVLREAQFPSNDWTFHVYFTDEDFGVWFKLKYA